MHLFFLLEGNTSLLIREGNLLCIIGISGVPKTSDWSDSTMRGSTRRASIRAISAKGPFTGIIGSTGSLFKCTVYFVSPIYPEVVMRQIDLRRDRPHCHRAWSSGRSSSTLFFHPSIVSLSPPDIVIAGITVTFFLNVNNIFDDFLFMYKT